MAQIEQNKLCIYYFRPYLVQKMVYLKVIQKITPMDVSVSENICRKTYLKKFRGASAPPWIRLWHVYLCDCYLRQTINNRVSGMLYQKAFYMKLQHGSQHAYQLTWCQILLIHYTVD